MFRLLRFFSLTSLLVVITAAAALSLYSRHSLHQTLIQHGQADNLVVAGILANALAEPLQQLQRGGDHNTRGFLQGSLRRLLEGRSVTQVAFYDPEGRLLFAQAQDERGLLGGDELRQLRARQVLSTFVTQPVALSAPGQPDTRYLIYSLVPIHDGNNRLTAVVGLHDDISALYRRSDQNR